MAAQAPERGGEVRRRLLEAAALLIGERGWTAVSTRVLAERAGVAPGLVHYHFHSLPALLREAAITAMRGVLAEAAPPRPGPGGAPDVLDAFLSVLDRYSGDDPGSLLFIEAYLAATRDGELRAELAGLLAQVRDALAARLAEAGQAEPETTASVLAAALDGLFLHRALNPELTAAAVGPVLRRLITTDGGAEAPEGEPA
ncbi:TetR/AcrR family transcriptional regulator [Allonocardiopsis opalescens]|uniref:TetR family transcriptional regulator n=1 Tax=Allonocardiopsis opalescens TaxID=1144618 RepID=A0A2T0QC78_9ACTN|nr:TetR/AcrR family transcriptional regulator [Allonocardiopsis opalescens]PRY01554.1 TetR family transcriptional regulator [Allonocardiopsis opalescens]